MAFETEGKLHVKMDTKKVTDSFQKRDFILEIEDGAYPQLIKFQLTQDRCDLLDDHNPGDIVKVLFNLRGRAYEKGEETIYFTNLDAWRIESLSNSKPAEKPASTGDDFPSSSDETFTEAGDDLPF